MARVKIIRLVQTNRRRVSSFLNCQRQLALGAGSRNTGLVMEILLVLVPGFLIRLRLVSLRVFGIEVLYNK